MTSSQPGFLQRHAGKLVASIVVTASVIYTLKNGGLPLVPSAKDFASTRWWIIPLYLASLAAMNWFRATRWRFLLRSSAHIPLRRIVAVSWIGFAAILVIPLRLGEIARPYMIRKRGVTMAAATGTVVAERVIDGLFLSIVLAVALLTVPTVHPLPDTVVGLPIAVSRVREAGFLMLAIFASAFTVIAVYYAARDFARRATFAVFGIVSKALAEKLANMASSLADGLKFLGRWSDAWPFFAETALYWFFNAFGMWILAWGAGVVHADGTGITFGESCGLMGMLGIAVLIPGPPGALGPFQLGIYAGMTMYYPTSVVIGTGAAYVFLLYVCQVIWTVLAALGFLVGDRTAWHDLEEAEGLVPETAPESP